MVWCEASKNKTPTPLGAGGFSEKPLYRVFQTKCPPPKWAKIFAIKGVRGDFERNKPPKP